MGDSDNETSVGDLLVRMYHFAIMFLVLPNVSQVFDEETVRENVIAFVIANETEI